MKLQKVAFLFIIIPVVHYDLKNKKVEHSAI